jgi:[ribosomal protein S5]-alanine N-acetyltransferase
LQEVSQNLKEKAMQKLPTGSTKNFGKRVLRQKLLKNSWQIKKTRPIFGRVAFDNYGSQKVLEKCDFIKIGRDKGFANARQTEIEEFIYKLA